MTNTVHIPSFLEILPQRLSRLLLPWIRRTLCLVTLALLAAFLGWSTLDGIFTTHRADKLCDAIHAEDIELVKGLLDKRVDPRWKNSYGKTSLRVADQHPDLEILKLMRNAAAHQ